ncbi:NAD+-dependent protein deacetylase SIR2 [Nematocida sp. AWRm80]|nr:NAD+-dependent protein deacetylase SIR2 [Nematocida sp. AWRm80]
MKKINIHSSYVYIKLASLIRGGKVSVIVGAGISTSCGIPDFRSKNGLFKEIKTTYGYSGEQIFTHSVIHSSESAMSVFISLICRLKEQLENIHPSDTHTMLAYLEDKHQVTIYTQNIDGLEKKAGITNNLIYLHGNIDYLICSGCKHITSYTTKLNTLLKETIKVNCPKCTERREQKEKENKRSTPIGRLLPNIVLYGDRTDTSDIVRSVKSNKQNDLLIVMGTSLRVYGVKNLTKELSRITKTNSGIRIYIGIESPPKQLQPYFDYWIEGECDTFSQSLLSTIKGEYLLKELQRVSIDRIDSLIGSIRRLSIDPLSKTEIPQ